MSQILISQLRLAAIIGVYPEERLAPQPLVLDIVLTVDTDKPAKSDDVADAVDYAVLIKNLQQWAAENSFYLLEALAHYLAKNIIKVFTQVQAVRLKLYKFPEGLPVASVSVEVFFQNDAMKKPS
jgi:dihydroneopterin aldolase